MHRLPSILLILFWLTEVCAQSPHGESFKINCSACHNPSGWTVNRDSISFDHNATSFRLEGTHAFTDCKSCHASLIFDKAPSQCLSCHTDVHSMSVGNDCARCHTPQNWLVNNIAELHEQNGFPLVGTHGNLNCIECHKSETNLRFDRLGNDCFSCHNDDYANAKDPDHAAAGYSTNCIECHDSFGGGWNADILHDFFPLVMGHDIADCKQCHLSNNFSDASPICSSCHLDDFNGTINPDHAGNSISTNCIECHDISGWVPSTFNHDAVYPFVGAHISISNDCNKCHNGNYTSTPNTCAGCHLPDYNNTSVPNHSSEQLPTDCKLCHDENSWIPTTYDHNAHFPLVGGHADVANDCNRCHNGNYTNIPNTCVSCHQADYNNTIEPNHAAAQFTTDCAQCHDENSWVPSTFDHNTIYPLHGAHAGIANDCNRCHSGGYTNTPNTCVGCHQTDYNSTTSPNHAAAQFPTDCAQCHTESSWMPSNFDHNTIYPLHGAHAGIANDCNRCHSGGYTNTPNTCVGCHQTDYNSTSNPNHAAAQFPTDCAQCHTESSWVPSNFDHSTIYPLHGAHAGIANDCNRCHINGNYTNTPNTCVGCHLTDYNNTINPNHATAQFPTDCAQCHDENAWTPSSFDHNTIYPLLGAHSPIANDCNLCHHGNYTNTPNTCAGCHLTDYNNTSNPNHSSAQIPTDCIQCHDQTTWTPANYDHNTIHPLLGAHAGIANDCNRCHINGNYTNTPNTCVGCHQTDYNNTSNPNHAAAQFPTDCAQCHAENAWVPVSFNHNAIHPLLGAHASIANDCNRCHSAGYTNTPNTCVGCHQTDYNSTTNPNHSTAGFSTDCVDCHSETAWTPATFDHDNDFFPIYSGKHQGKWSACTDCHLGGNYSTFSCINCHEHNNQADLNNKHSGVSGYAYNSNACLNCHPQGD